ncbi:endomucin isoform X2 [Aythya fuligula]|uniref:Endomucin isoform X2 n=1 Tax=Aythya fuligula TaxID=219594 RepID=A0A6J3CY17_AYTFU|nr:endomucin isoform X2 [Aythya fuligula]
MEKDEKLHENRWLGRGQRPPNSVPRERNQHGGPHTLPSLLPSQCMHFEETEIPQGNVGVSAPVTTLTSVSEAVSEAVSMSSSQVTSLQPSVLANTAAKATTVSVTTGSMPSSTTAKQGTTEGTTVTTVQQTTAPTLAARNEDDNTTSTAQVNGTQATQNESVGALSTKRWPLPPTTSPQKHASSETSSLHVITLTEPSNVVVTESSPGNTKMQEGIIRYSNVILPVVITLIVITFSVFSLVALYRICHKKAPERQENGTEQAQLDKEGVKLLSVKITTPETGFCSPGDISEVAP